MALAKVEISGKSAVVKVFDKNGTDLDFQLDLGLKDSMIDIHVTDEKAEAITKATRALIEALDME